MEAPKYALGRGYASSVRYGVFNYSTHFVFLLIGLKIKPGAFSLEEDNGLSAPS